MHLAKPRFDVGLVTHNDNAEAMLAFWQREVGLPFDHLLPVGRGVHQHRHEMLGSVLKINAHRNALPERPPSGYHELRIARPGLTASVARLDPDGNRVRLVPPGSDGIERIGVWLRVRNVESHRRFYRAALGLTELPGGSADRAAFLVGDSVLLVKAHPDAPSDASGEGRGYRYLTLQVFQVDEAHTHVLAHGGRQVLAPVTLGSVARISMVRDPDGNFIELSQRASITGSLD